MNKIELPNACYSISEEGFLIRVTKSGEVTTCKKRQGKAAINTCLLMNKYMNVTEKQRRLLCNLANV